MATVYKRPKPDGSVSEYFYAKFMKPNGSRIQRCLKTSNRREAERRASLLEAQLIEGRFVEKPKVSITLAELLDRWMAYAEKHKKSHSRDAQAVKMIVPIIGNVRIAYLSGDDLDRYARKRKVADSTIRRDLAVVTAAMNKAVKWKLIERSPIEGYELPPAGKPRERVLTDDEIMKIRSHLTPTVALIVDVALDTALRLSNARLLQWEWIDFNEGIMTIPPVETKNKKPHIAVMTRKVRQILLKVREKGPKQGYVFLSRTGEPYEKDSVSNAFRDAVKKAEIKNARFHDLRHTALTRAAAQGATGPDLMFMAGHSDLRMTARYTHQDLDRRRKVAAMLDELECHQSVTTRRMTAG